MCGIAGWINLKSDLTNQKEILNSMIDRLTPGDPMHREVGFLQMRLLPISV